MTDGEKLHEAGRKRFWRTLFISGLFAIPLGFAVGFSFGYSRGDLDAFWTSAPDWLVILLVALAAIGLVYGSWRFRQSIDEVELQDNLWSSTAAYGAYSLLFPAWWALGKAGITPEPNDWLIYLIALAIGLAVYFQRKVAAR